MHSPASGNRLHGSWVKVHLCRKNYGIRATVWNGEKHLERRVHTQYFVHALVDIKWTDKGILHRGQGFMLDINIKGIFTYSDPEPPGKGRS